MAEPSAGQTLLGRAKRVAQPVIIAVLAIALTVTMVFTFSP
jgi:hypothetical protein